MINYYELHIQFLLQIIIMPYLRFKSTILNSAFSLEKVSERNKNGSGKQNSQNNNNSSNTHAFMHIISEHFNSFLHNHMYM